MFCQANTDLHKQNKKPQQSRCNLSLHETQSIKVERESGTKNYRMTMINYINKMNAVIEVSCSGVRALPSKSGQGRIENVTSQGLKKEI